MPLPELADILPQKYVVALGKLLEALAGCPV
jgi:hypothetical protein